ncbi:hypothetical protein HVA01_32980 [Halovibrio variabilis]|uniref:Uncharacterized protein n=1 Tax=Halovibrio variabilis TaxID=31910 RepID=A0A511UWY1_9GAMM|nr:hypothetical protein [Halovibrio variabilis]GEN29652.1 hypothetical protein HVA01_32980 [Halovibrio variabilis]
MKTCPNPIDIIEKYFNIELRTESLEEFDGIDSEQWIDFSKTYLKVMESGFASAYLDEQVSPAHKVRIYFEPTLKHDWAKKLEERFAETPLLGYRAFLPKDPRITRAVVSEFLNPLKKHLLLADSVFIPDNFYRSFDMVADSVSRDSWRNNPNTVRLVKDSIARIRAYLPILAELRDFIRCNALVFMPYYITPTFPYANVPRKLKDRIDRLRVIDPTGEIWGSGFSTNEFNKVLVPWLNARLLGLDPVFLTDTMARVAGTLCFDDDAISSPASDLLSVRILPFGGASEIDLDMLWSMRSNESVFSHVRRLTAQCKEHLEDNLGPGSTQRATEALSRQFLQDHLASLRTERVISLANKPCVGLTWRIGLAVTTVGTSEIISAAASSFLDTSIGKAVLSRLSPERRAISYLNAAL